MALTDNLSCYYKLDGNSNKSFGTNNGTDTSMTYGTGKIDQGAVFNGSTSKILVNDSADFTFGSSDFSCSVWIKRAVTGARQIFIGQSNSGGLNGTISFIIEASAANLIIATVCVGSTASTATQATGTVNDTNWHHIVLVRDSGTIRLYIDGSANGTASISGTVNDSSNPFGIGVGGSLASLLFNGTIDEVGVWKRKLDTTEITQLYNNGNGLSYPFTSASNFFLFM